MTPFSKKILVLCFCLSIFLRFGCTAIQTLEIDEVIKSGLEDGLTVDLKEPHYSSGILSTQKGGVITAKQIRIQAIHIVYTKKVVDGQKIWTIEAEGDLIVEFGDYIFVGEKLFYDFENKQGTIYRGKTSVEPWFFGGEKLDLLSDGSTIIYDGYVTTSEKDVPDWAIFTRFVQIDKTHRLKAQDVSIKLYRFPVLWIPALSINLNAIFDSPIRYRFRWGGRQGPRFGLTYELFSWDNWKTFVRFDYRLTRGPGGGIETRYHSEDHKTEFQSINYLAKDSSILHPHDKARYRFEGVFRKLMDDDKTSILMTYDKISDRDMPSSYYDRDFDFDTSKRTQLLIRKQEENWIANLYSRIRINSFQTVKQELPSLELDFKPFALKDTGIIFENYADASYLDFKYSKFLVCVHNYSSSRFEYRPTLYRPIALNSYFTLTPEIGAVAILYGNGPKHEEQKLFLGKAGLTLETQLFRFYGPVKHVIEPYARYRYYSAPTSSPHQHFIFDINDGWTRLNYLSFGINNSFFIKEKDCCIKRLFAAKLYSFAFFDQNKMRQAIPRVYGKLTMFLIPTIKQVLDTAWNLEHNQIDYFNIRTEWTLNADFAVACEFLHRGPFTWRKVDRENFFLDVFRSERQLLHSPLSDRRDTFLLHFFYRFHPNWAVEFTSRQGWNRKHEPRYTEYEIDLLTTVQTAWHLRFSFQHQEKDTRFAMYLNIGLTRPDQPPCENKPICFD